MYISELKIIDFRLFKDINIKLGRNLTIVAGQNMTGKSTILALLGHSCQYVKREKASKPLLHTNFQCNWGEIIKPNPDEATAPHIATINYCLDNGTYYQEFRFRTTRQNDGTRWRMLPKYPDKPGSSKMVWPTLYLGLSRLFPIGESSEIEQSISVLRDWENEFRESYKKILNIEDEIKSIEGISLTDVKRKKGVGISTTGYSSYANSAGQDNVGQIIAAVLSFIKLKKYLADNWNGGLLLIDEIDATLHPIAQQNLFHYLLNFSKENNVQVVMTTHSLSLLEYAEPRYYHNDNNSVGMNSIELAYLTSGNGPVQVHRNFSYQGIRNDMLNTTSFSDKPWHKVTVYCEDDEARWFLEKLFPQILDRIHLPTIKMGYSSLLDLLRHDYKFFSSHIFLLDSDVKQQDIDNAARLASVQKFKNLLCLPGNGNSLEKTLYEYIMSLDPSHPIFLNIWLAENGFNLRNISLSLQLPSDPSQKERDSYKKWFSDNKLFINELIPYWIEDNADIVSDFKDRFVLAFNFAAKAKGVPVFAPAGQNIN